jgi:HAD superfamily hydrolase (TIGR01509 family)
VQEHVRSILSAADARLIDRLPGPVMDSLVEVYSRPALLVPPAVDPAALTVLQGLRNRDCTLALVSNTMRTPGAILRKLLEHYRLRSYFAHTTFSDEVGVRKPHPDIFALTLRAVGGEAATSVHVGDDSVLDVQGARAAGLRAIQVRTGHRRPGAVQPDAAIASLADLPAAIDKLETG